jgi:large conductance mechanosensitive channel
MGLLQEFKTFALKGNVVDMAVGVIIGGAFGKIVTSLVNDIIMPPIGVLTGGVDFKDLGVVIQKAVPEVLNEAGEVVTPAVAEVVWKYGAFIQQVIDFLIIAISVFVMIKLINKLSTLRKKEEEAAPAPAPEPAPEPEPTKEEVLLAEIRDLLKQQK